MTVRTLGALLVAAALFCTAPGSWAQYNFDPKTYDALVSSDSSQTIPEGTQITLGNWQQYRQFMPVAMQALYSGKYEWKVGAGPEYTVVVGPTFPTPLPKQFVADTEKYSAQTKLLKLPNGAYSIENYAAGLPFPKPAQPDMGAKVYFNAYYEYRPAYSYSPDLGWNEDRFHNATLTDATVASYRLSHISETGFAANPSYGKGYLFGNRYVLLAPEQNRYLAEIALYSDDPNRMQEAYLFLPSLRRSLRLSAAARCSPLLGSDYVQDDNNNFLGVQVSQFALGFVGQKKLLAKFHQDPATDGKIKSYVPPAGSMPAWPLPVAGKWELRDVYVIDIQALPEAAKGYCYGHKIVYIDRQSWVPLATDIYDPNGKLWKIALLFYQPWPINGNGEMAIVPQTGVNVIADLEAGHTGLSMQYDTRINDDAPKEYQNATVMAFPGSLAQIMK